MTWDGQIDVEIVSSTEPSEIGFLIRHVGGAELTPQMVMDAIAEVIMTEWGSIPTRKLEDMDG